MINNFCDLLNAIGFDVEPKEIEKKFDGNKVRNGIRSSKTITGAFNRLTEDEKKTVVDSLNTTQKMFDSIFGIKSSPWTSKDLDGSYVSVQTSGTEPEKDKCECEKKCDEKNEECKCQEQKKQETQQSKNISIADALKGEIARGTHDDELAEAIVDKVVEKLTDKKKHDYELHPGTSEVEPTVVTTVRLLNDKVEDVLSNASLLDITRLGIIQKVGCKDVWFTNKEPGCINSNTIMVTLVL